MFKIDKSSVEFLDANRFLTVVPSPDQMNDAALQNAAQHSDDPTDKSAPEKVQKPDENQDAMGASFDKTSSVAPRDTETEYKNALELAKNEADDIRNHASTAAAKQLEDAKYESFCIISEASNRAEQIGIEAWQKGYNEGLAQLAQQSETHKREFEGLMQSILSQTNQFTQSVNAAFEENVLRLSFAIAEKIVNITFKNNDSIFEQLVKRTIQLHHEESRFFLRVSPSAYERYFQSGSDWLRAQIECAPFKVIADATLPEYGILLETEEGLYKTGPDVQLGILKEALGVKGSADEAVL